jgi:hypothetical protein
MQDGMTPHTAKESIRALRGVFRELNGENTIISRGLWFPRSPDLNPLIFICGESSKVLRLPTILVALK